jgi:hypothetical protein
VPGAAICPVLTSSGGGVWAGGEEQKKGERKCAHVLLTFTNVYAFIIVLVYAT